MEMYTRQSLEVLGLLMGDIKGYQSKFTSLIRLGNGIAILEFTLLRTNTLRECTIGCRYFIELLISTMTIRNEEVVHNENRLVRRQHDMSGFISTPGRFYPCWHCEDDFRACSP
jgi:hypothetical protein